MGVLQCRGPFFYLGGLHHIFIEVRVRILSISYCHPLETQKLALDSEKNAIKNSKLSPPEKPASPQCDFAVG